MVGTPMEFWRRHMPEKMALRSDADWHLDPFNVHTIDRFFAETGRTRQGETPFSLRTYLAYVDWFQQQSSIRPIEARVVQLEPPAAPGRTFRAMLDTGETIDAQHVAVAVGFWYFRHVPRELEAVLPPGRWSHACEAVDMASFAGRRVTIVGGRQSAFEWAALLCESGAAHVDIVHRHDSPRFAESEWEWIPPLVARTEQDPSWFRRLSESEQKALAHKLWAEGRLKLEPWLEPRLRGAPVSLWPNAEISRSEIDSDRDRARSDVRRETAGRPRHPRDRLQGGHPPRAVSGDRACSRPPAGSQWLSGARRALPDEHSRPVHHQHGRRAGLRALFWFHGLGTRVGPDHRPLAPPGMRLVVGVGIAASGLLWALPPRATETRAHVVMCAAGSPPVDPSVNDADGRGPTHCGADRVGSQSGDRQGSTRP